MVLFIMVLLGFVASVPFLAHALPSRCKCVCRDSFHDFLQNFVKADRRADSRGKLLAINVCLECIQRFDWWKTYRGCASCPVVLPGTCI